jgi:hypothetical protein
MQKVQRAFFKKHKLHHGSVSSRILNVATPTPKFQSNHENQVFNSIFHSSISHSIFYFITF